MRCRTEQAYAGQRLANCTHPWTTGAISHAKLQSNHHHQQTKPTPSFLQVGCPSCRPTNSVKALKGKISHSMDLLTPSSSGDLPTLSLTTSSSWLPWGGLPCLSSALSCQYLMKQKKYRFQMSTKSGIHTSCVGRRAGTTADALIADQRLRGDGPIALDSPLHQETSEHRQQAAEYQEHGDHDATNRTRV